MEENFRRVIAGTLSALLVGQVMIFGDGTAQGILHKETLTAAAESIEEMKNAKELKAEYDAATEGLGEVDYFTLPNTIGARRRVQSVNTMSVTEDENSSSIWDEVMITEEPITAPDSLVISGYVKKGAVPNHSESDTTPIYVRVFNGNWEEISSVQTGQDGSYSVTATGSDVYHVKFECDGYLPFYLRDFGTGTFRICSANSVGDVNGNTLTLIPGDTTYNEDNGNLWSDDKLTEDDAEYVWDHVGAQLGDPNFNPSMDLDNDGIVSQADLDTFCELYSELSDNPGTYYDMTGLSVLSYDIDLNGVINEHDYDLLYDMVHNGASTSGYNIPDFISGTPTENDLLTFRGIVDSARTITSWVYVYNHEMTGDVIVNPDDYVVTSINATAQLRGPVGEYLAYMDRNGNGVVEQTEAQWFSDAYSAYGYLEWDKAFARTFTLLSNAQFPYGLNLHDTNLDLNGYSMAVYGHMSFTTDTPVLWDDQTGDDQFGAILDINGGYLNVQDNLVFRTASLDGWSGTPGQTMELNGGKVIVGGEFQFGQVHCNDVFKMTDPDDRFKIKGNIRYVTDAIVYGQWTDGVLWFSGSEWSVNEESGALSIFSSDHHIIVFDNSLLDGNQQKIYWDNPNTYISELDGTPNTLRTFNFGYVDEEGNLIGLLFYPDGYYSSGYFFRPWFQMPEVTEPDYTLYRKGWEIGDGVHIATGNYTKSFTDLSVASPGVKSDFVRTYNSMSDEEGSFGIGWDFNIDVSKIIIPANGYYQVVLPDGSNTTFKDNGNGGFECLNAHSTMTRSGDEYTVINAAQSQYHFNANGELDRVTDANGNPLYIETLSDIQKRVTDSTGRTYTITYDYISEHKRIKSIADDASERNRIVHYAYNNDAQLVSATSVSGGTEYYEYDADGRLCKITNCYDEITDQMAYYSNGSVDWLTNAAGLKQVYTYNSNLKQTGLQEYDGETLVKTFTYDYDEKYAVRKNIVDTATEHHIVDEITYTTINGENRYDEMSESIDIMGNTTKYDRDANGNVTKTTNPDGTYTLASYNDKNMPVVQVDESNNAIVYVYDETGINVTAKYESLEPVANGYAVISDPTLLTYDNSAVTYYSYYNDHSIKGLVHEITDPDGYVTEYVYGTEGDAEGLPIAKTVKDGNEVVSKVEYEYNSQLQVSMETTWVDIANHVVSVKEYEYDSFNNVTKVSDKGTGNIAAVTITDYDLLSRKTAEYSPNYSSDRSHGTLYTYYPSGAVKTQTDAEGNVTSFAYDAYGNQISKINPDGTINITEYDGLQREKATYFKSSAASNQQILTATSYLFEPHSFDLFFSADGYYGVSYKGLRTTKTTYITAAKQVVTSTLSDFRGNPVEEKTNGETKRTSGYYQNGQLARQTDALGNSTKYEYRWLNKLTKTYVPLANYHESVTENTYDKRGNVIKVTQTVQEQNDWSNKHSITENQYNALGLLTQVKLRSDFSDEVNVSKYFYNNAGIQTKMYTGLSSEDGDNTYLTTQYTYDPWMRLVTTTDSTGYNSGTIIYDLNGNVLTTTDANGNVTTNTYDAINRVLTSNAVHPTASSKNVSKTFTYDNMGRITQAVNNNITTTYQYDSLGRKYTEYEYSNNYSVFRGYFYEGVSQYVSEELTGQTNLLLYSVKQYTYDSEMRVSTVKESGNGITAYTYDANGNKLTETMANGVVSTYSYNQNNKVTGIVNTSGNSTISEYEYTYYLDGSDACKKRTENGIMEVTSYEYDGLKRLTQEAVTTGSTTDTYTYEYDDYGNRSEMTATGSANFTTVYDYDDAQGNYTALLQKEIKTSADVTPLPGQEVTPEQTVYTYDANGSQLTKTTSEGTETNTYNAANQLVGFADSDTTASYAYNSNGLRVEKTVDGQRINHVWDGSQQIVADVIDSQYYEAQCYIRGTSLAAAYHYTNGAKSDYTYYVQNAHGDVVNLTDADGAVTKTYHYDAFGVEIDLDTGDVNAFRFCGEYFDTESGTIYLRARYYQASIGRFTQRDSVTGKIGDPLSLNLYTYCHNNPVYYFDPNGHKVKDNYEQENQFTHTLNVAIDITISMCKEKIISGIQSVDNKVERMRNRLSKKNLTISVGKTDSFAVYFVSPSFSNSIAADTKGDVAVQYSWGIAMMTEVLGISRTQNITITNAKNVKALEGEGGAVGLAGGEVLSGGIDFVYAGYTIPDSPYYGGAITVGGGVGFSPLDFHLQSTDTNTVKVADNELRLNLFDVYYSVSHRIKTRLGE